jgi:WD40 repeat protein
MYLFGIWDTGICLGFEIWCLEFPLLGGFGFDALDEDTTFGAEPERLGELFALGLGPEEPAEPDTAVTQWDLLQEKPGSHIARYQLLETIGEGGMGVIYLARQEHPIQRQVAIKFIKPGMDSARVVARFQAEQQALALMEHPHIARVYDAGIAPSGRPYFVMEYVPGLPITEYCDRRELTVEQRLDLFLHICAAVQHAHTKGIIHRDLKPSNILVVDEGKEAVPKIIDFGIARALSRPTGERTLFTEQGQLIGTPEYMSPELLDAGRQDIDTRTDIYSLGLILYQLIAGVLPFEPQTVRTGSFEQIRRIIREQDPPTPSTRLSKTSAEESAASARRRHTDLRTLKRKLRGDLDWITLKALEKDRTRRYETAESLARDIEHHLRDEPVTAGPPGRFYRFGKLVRRNQAVFVGTTAVVAALAVGLAASAVLLVREQQARRVAVAAQAKEAALRRQSQARAYASDMSLAQQALAMNDLGRARRLLEAHQPAPGEVDPHGWEWRYLWQQCQNDARSELYRYSDSACSVAYSPDGKVLAVAGHIQGFVEVWDVPGRQRIATLQPNEGQVMAFSPRGNLLATNAGNEIRLWRTGPWEFLRPLSLPGFVWVLKFSPDGRRLACMNGPDEVTVWEVDQWTIVRRIKGLRRWSSLQGALDFSPSGAALVIGDAGHRLQMVDLASGNTNFDIPEAHPEPITAVAWSPSGTVIASASGWSGGPIQLREAASGRPLGKLEGHTSWVSELIFSVDSRWLYSAGADQTIRIWDVAEQRCLAILRGSSDVVFGLTLSPDGATLASACKDGVVAFWDAYPRPEAERSIRITTGQTVRPAFAPDSRVVAVPRGGTVSLFDLRTLEEIEQIPDLGANVWSVAYSPDGALLVSGSTGRRIQVWSCVEHRLLRKIDDLDVPPYLMGFSADGRQLLSIGAREKAILWDTRTWQAVRTFTAGAGSACVAAVSPDGRHVVLGGREGTVRWFNGETGELELARSDIHRFAVSGITFSADGTQAASVSDDGTLVFWDPCLLQQVTVFRAYTHGIGAVAFSPDGCRLATGAGNTGAVKLWDMSTHRELILLPGLRSTRFVTFSPDGQWLAACGVEGKLHLWQAPSREEIAAAEE